MVERGAIPNYRTPFSQFLEFVGDIENVGEGLEDSADQIQPFLDLLCAQNTIVIPGEGGQVVMGHSERREYHSESDELVGAKARKVLDAGMTWNANLKNGSGELCMNKNVNVDDSEKLI